MLDRFRGRHVLMLQGPNGHFFRNVARHLRRYGAKVTKINFNPGDAFFYREGEIISFSGELSTWPGFFQTVVEQKKVDATILFGDCRIYHRMAIEVAQRLGIDVYVFEEGYLRPDFVTLEQNGVNGHSSISRDPETYRGQRTTRLPSIVPVGPIFLRAAWYSGVYALMNSLFGWRVPHYQHHRDLNALRQAYFWGRSGVRKTIHRIRDRELNRRILEGDLPPYFFVPLQVYLDSQLGHSRYGSIEAFIVEVVESFANHAPEDHLLIVKQHPFDRPYRDYSRLFRDLGRRLNLSSRLVYADVINLPHTLKRARGTVVINSTVGFSSVQHGTPTLCLGYAVYDIPGLTYQGKLDEFWQDPGRVDLGLYRKFRWWLRTNNQLNGSVWSDLYLPEPSPSQKG